MARSSAHRVKVATAGTGVVVAGVLAMSSLAGAQSVDHDHDMEETTTTVAPTTVAPTTTVVATTSTVATTTTTTRVPTVTQVGDVYAPGDHVTLSGSGCLIDGKPGIVIVALATEPKVGLLPETATADAGGSYRITVTLPADAASGLAVLVAGCTDGVAPDFALDGLAFVIQRPGEPVGRSEQNAGALKSRAVAKIISPKAVTASPKFTG
jgi:hypothetical protein